MKELQLEEARKKKVAKERDLKYYSKKLEQLKLKIEYIEKDIDIINVVINLIKGNDIEAANQYKDLLKSDYTMVDFMKDYNQKNKEAMPTEDIERIKHDFLKEYNKGEKSLIELAKEFKEKGD